MQSLGNQKFISVTASCYPHYKEKGGNILKGNSNVFDLNHKIKKFTATYKQAGKVNNWSRDMEW
jgi:hypothetical protein